MTPSPRNIPVVSGSWLWDKALLENLADFSGRWKGARVLEVGCGAGLLAARLSALGALVTAFDFEAYESWKEHPGPAFLRARGEALPFRDGAFDFVISCTTFQYMDLPMLVPEMLRVARGGTLLLHENLPGNPLILLFRAYRRARSLFSPGSRAYLGSIRQYASPRVLRALLKGAGGGAGDLTSLRFHYFLTPPVLLLPRGSRLAMALLAFDTRLIARFAPCRALSWFCAYRVQVHGPSRA